MPIGTRRRCLMKKTGHEKSRDTVPLKDCAWKKIKKDRADPPLKKNLSIDPSCDPCLFS